jgi:hypothetical protein
MSQDAETELLTITLSEQDKRTIRIEAAARGVSMRSIIREWIRALPSNRARHDDEE